MITDAVQCRWCYKYATLGHTCCECGLLLLGASEEVQKKFLKNVINCFKKTHNKRRGKTLGCNEDSHLYHKAREHHNSAIKKTRLQSILERYLKDDWYRPTLQSQGVTEVKVKEWDSLAEGPKREHVATAAARERWSKNVLLEADDSR